MWEAWVKGVAGGSHVNFTQSLSQSDPSHDYVVTRWKRAYRFLTLAVRLRGVLDDTKASLRFLRTASTGLPVRLFSRGWRSQLGSRQ